MLKFLTASPTFATFVDGHGSWVADGADGAEERLLGQQQHGREGQIEAAGVGCRRQGVNRPLFSF